MISKAGLTVSFVVTLLVYAAQTARANDVISHMHISDLAREQLPPGDLRDLLDDPELTEAYRAGSVFPDTGYAAHDAYGEMAHWEPFVDEYLRYIQETYGPSFDSLEARQQIAFLLGFASHGMADQWYDALFMARVDQYDGGSDNLDIATGPWLIVEHNPGYQLEGWLDATAVNTVFAERMGYEPGVEALEHGMGLIVSAVAALYFFADDLYEGYWYEMTWAATHYYLGEEDAPGSLLHTTEVIARYWQVLWARLHGTDEAGDSFLRSWPLEGSDNFEVDPALIESQVVLAFGHGVDRATLTNENVRLLDAAAGEVSSRVSFIYGPEFGNVIRVRPTERLDYDADYTVELGTALTLMDGRSLPEPVTVTVHTRCAPDRLDDCPPLPPAWEAPDGPPERPDDNPDAGTPDADTPDADISDAGTLDADPDSAPLDVDGGGCQGCRIGGPRSPRFLNELLARWLWPIRPASPETPFDQP